MQSKIAEVVAYILIVAFLTIALLGLALIAKVMLEALNA